MATGADVLRMKYPNGGYIITGNEYEGIQFLECEPITKKEFEAGFVEADEFQRQHDQNKASQKTALLAKLGITADEAALLLS